MSQEQQPGGAPYGAAAISMAAARRYMVERHLRPRGITDERVLEAMGETPREEFVAACYRGSAYDDCPLPIGYGQTISQPFTVAYMLQALRLKGDERVLEIGAGSGYGAAVLARLAHAVYTMDRIPEFVATTRTVLQRLGCANVRVQVGDGTLGWEERAPFDAIIATAGGRDLPTAYRRQLAEGGRIVIPLGNTPTSQRLKRFSRQGGEMSSQDLGAFAFVPLIGRDGWGPDSAPPLE